MNAVEWFKEEELREKESEHIKESSLRIEEIKVISAWLKSIEASRVRVK